MMETTAREIAEAVQAAIQEERRRCAAIVQAAREGEVDNDLRSIIHLIKSGVPAR